MPVLTTRHLSPRICGKMYEAGVCSAMLHCSDTWGPRQKYPPLHFCRNLASRISHQSRCQRLRWYGHVQWAMPCFKPGDGGGRPSSVMSLGVASVGRSLPWASGVPDRCGIFVGRYRPQIPRALGCQRGLALADLGCTVDHLGPTPANLIPPSSFAVSCDLKALWPGVLGC